MVLTPKSQGVLYHDRGRAFPGLNILTDWGDVSGCPIFDNDGAVLAKLPGLFCTFVPGAGVVLVNGDKVMLLGPDLKPRWQFAEQVHHDISYSPERREIAYLGYARDQKSIPGVTLVSDTIWLRDISGRELFHWNSIDHLRQITEMFKPWDLFTPFFEVHPAYPEQYAMGHLNSVQIIPPGMERDGPAFRSGNLLVSFLFYGAIAVIDRNTGEIIWHSELARPKLELHSPHFMPDGRIVFFKNRDETDPRSSLMILNPRTGRIEWEYVGEPKQFYSLRFGHVQVLPNGNFLVTDNPCVDLEDCRAPRPDANAIPATAGGHAFEIGLDKKIVWEWASGRFDDNGHRGEIYRVQRVPTSEADDFRQMFHR